MRDVRDAFELADWVKIKTVDLLAERGALIDYLASKLRSRDWHAVQDAGSDIREIDAQLSLLTELLRDAA